MVRRFSHILAILTACATVLAGIAPFAVGLPSAPGPGTCLSSAPFDTDDAADPRVENSGKELEEKEKQQEDVDTRIHLFTGGPATIQLTAWLYGSADPDTCPVVRSSSALAFSIRGPPSVG